jgi:hypothetical protein
VADWTVDDDGRLAYNVRPAEDGEPWCDDLIGHSPFARRHATIGQEAHAALVADVRAARLADDMAEQFIITAGTNIYGSVGPFPSIAAAEDYYRANQPQGAPWLTEPTIIRLLRPAPVGEVAALQHARQQEET